jgi:hypothetical protein
MTLHDPNQEAVADFAGDFPLDADPEVEEDDDEDGEEGDEEEREATLRDALRAGVEVAEGDVTVFLLEAEAATVGVLVVAAAVDLVGVLLLRPGVAFLAGDSPVSLETLEGVCLFFVDFFTDLGVFLGVFPLGVEVVFFRAGVRDGVFAIFFSFCSLN